MADCRPFKAYRPASADLAGRLAALPYDVVNEEEARGEIRREPLSFLAIDRPETAFPEGTDPYSDAVYAKAAAILQERIDAGYYVQDAVPCYYLYAQTFRGRTQTGIVGAASVEDYLQGVIKKHENTRADKELDRIRHVDTCSAQTGPIFLAYRTDPALAGKVAAIRTAKEPVCDFESAGGVRNRVWVVDAPEDVAAIEAGFQAMDSLYIADGHHRCASAVKVALQRRESRDLSPLTQTPEYEHFLAVLFPEEELCIMDYNRVILDWNGRTPEELLQFLGQFFTISEMLPSVPEAAQKRGEILLNSGGTWRKLTLQETFRPDDPVAGLDVSILQDLVLGPFFGIGDPRTDPRIDFVGGIRGTEELERRVADGAACAFRMAPVSMKELMDVADAGRLMPPKSTWFEPKLLSGLFIHRI